MQVFLGIAYFIVGIVQFFAIVDGIDHALDIGGLVAFIIAAFTTYIPLLGAALGVYGAVNEWAWPLWQADLLFFWYIPAFLIFAAVTSITER